MESLAASPTVVGAAVRTSPGRQRLTYKQVRDQFNLKVEKRENAQVRGPYGTMGVSADGKCGKKDIEDQIDCLCPHPSTHTPQL